MPHISLVVDDEPAVRRYITSILQGEHFETVEVANGRHGLEIVRMFGGDVDLIVADIQMPGGDGLTFARAVKESFPSIPVILISAGAAPDTEFDGFIQKPFRPRALVSAVRNAVAHAAGHVH